MQSGPGPFVGSHGSQRKFQNLQVVIKVDKA